MRPAGSDPASMAARAAGCWVLSWQVDDPDPGSRTTAPAYGELPDCVSFEASVLFGSDRRLVSPATDPLGRGFAEGGGSSEVDGAPGGEATWEELYRTNRWWIDDDRISVLFSQGEGVSWSLSLEPVAGGLEGTAVFGAAEGVDDAPPTAEVEARSIDCPPV